MCGIVGKWNRGGVEVGKGEVEKMIMSLVHRGPDEGGVYTDKGIGLGHRRLSIIDLTLAAKQPMVSGDGRYVLVFNGEIYNYRELRDEFLSDWKFVSKSDTEVLLDLLIVKREKALGLLKGMFALAFWDKEKSRLLLARDPFGKKPLYYIDTGDCFLFASEVKALLLDKAVSSSVDYGSAGKYFLHEYVPSPASGFRGVKQLPMGGCAVVDESGTKVERWWQPAFLPKARMSSEDEVAREFDGYLRKAVERRLVADVPVGLLLSGGIDSTSIGWYMQDLADSPIHSFSVSFKEKSFDEKGMASRAAESLGTKHHDVVFGVDQFRQALEELVKVIDVPFGDSSLLPTYWVSKEAVRWVKVALDGDGSDELLAGYGTFRAAEVSEKLPRVSPGFWNWLADMAGRLPTSYEYFSFDFKLKSFLRGLAYDLPYRNQIWLGSFTERELEKLWLAKEGVNDKNVFSCIDDLGSETRELKTIDAVSLLTIHHYLHNDILVKLDRASMAASLEARTPFLDVDLAEYVMKLPVKYKRDKYILKRVMRGRIPDEIVDRPKKGFAIPLGHWLRGPLYGWVGEVLDEDKVKEDGVLNWGFVKDLIEEHREGRSDHRKKLWTVLMWQLWYDNWVKKR
jgi:asparagine synthase (glutamine-hydrolysing)